MATKAPSNTVLPILVAALAVLGGGVWFYMQQPPPQPPILELTQQVEEYIRSLKLQDVSMKAHDSFLGQRVVEITGKISNQGDREVQIVEINCVFTDPYGQPIHRDRVQIVSPKMGGLKPGQTKSFRLPFEGIPGNWNQVMPHLVIAGIKFA